jgi:hypothetical protein
VKKDELKPGSWRVRLAQPMPAQGQPLSAVDPGRVPADSDMKLRPGFDPDPHLPPSILLSLKRNFPRRCVFNPS